MLVVLSVVVAGCITSMPHTLLFVFNVFHSSTSYILRVCVCMVFSFVCFYCVVSFCFRCIFYAVGLCDLGCQISPMCFFSTLYIFFTSSHIIGLFLFWFRLNDYNARWRHVGLRYLPLMLNAITTAKSRWSILNGIKE